MRRRSRWRLRGRSQRGAEFGDVGRHVRAPLHRTARLRMNQPEGATHAAPDARQPPGQRRNRPLAARAAIHRIAEQRMPDMRAMHADLMRAPGFQGRIESPKPVAAPTPPSRRGGNAYAQACPMRPSRRPSACAHAGRGDRRVDRAFVRHRAPNEREIAGALPYAPAIAARDRFARRACGATTISPDVSYRADARCPRAAGRRRRRHSDAANRSAPCRSSCPLPDARRARRAWLTTTIAASS